MGFLVSASLTLFSILLYYSCIRHFPQVHNVRRHVKFDREGVLDIIYVYLLLSVESRSPVHVVNTYC